MTPKQDGYYFPSELSPHKGTILMLPYRKDTWNYGGKKAREIFFEMAQIISKYEELFVVIDPSIYQEEKNRFEELPNTKVIEMAYNDAWARDIMPSIVTNGSENRVLDFRFNAWGGTYDGLYDCYQEDDKCKRKMAFELGYSFYHLDDFILEGGSIHVDETKTLLTTEACLLSPGRNPKYSKEEIILVLKEYYGVEKVIFIPNGIVEDETDEHIDNMACFLGNKRILVATSNNPQQLENTRKALEVLKNETNALGQKYEVITIPIPTLYTTKKDVEGIEVNDSAKKRLDGARLATSYINFYIGNGFILFPQFDCKEDLEALTKIKELMPSYDVYPIQSKEILLGGGNIHCVTQQIPLIREEKK